MNLYLDDDSVDRKLALMLHNAGRRVTLPADVGKSGANDPVHLMMAVRLGCVLITRNDKHFREIHELIQECGGTHRGILTVRFDDNRKHRMKPHQIVNAIAKLEASGLDVTNQLIILNHWR